MEKLKTYIGALAIEKGCLTQEQLDECIALLDSEESDKTIEQILVAKKYITEEHVTQLKKKRLLNIKKLEDPAFIDYVKKMKIVPQEKLVQCLEVQAKAKQDQNTYIPISMLLVSHGIMSQEAVDEILKSKNIRRVIQETIWRDDPRRTGLVGRVLGGYEILSKIAEGGMGVVYRAMQIELERIIALKILFDKFAAQKKHLNQFFREARLSGMLNHPNLVHIFDMGRDQGFYYYAMELVEGNNLGDYLKAKEKLPQEEALDIISQAGRGLEHIHSFDVVHRDIKPSNFIIRGDGIVKIMDLGLACNVSNIPKKAASLGTPHYMAPELVYNPEKVNQRADIYALGVSFYRMLTNEYPITGDNAKEILNNLKEQMPIPVRQHEPNVSVDIQKVIDKSLDKDPDRRYQTMTEMLHDLDRILI